MDSTRSFEILFRKKIPYWSELLFGIIAIFFLFLFLLYLIMLPSERSSDEMKVGYYILVVPDWLKTMSAYSFFGLLIFIPIYSVSKSYKPGLIHFTSEYLLITDNPTKQLSIKSIKKIFLNDVKRWFKSPRQAAEVVITQTGNRKTSFLLKRYEESEGFIESLSKLENVEFGFYNEWSINTHDDD